MGIQMAKIKEWITDLLCMAFIMLFGIIVWICIPEDELYQDYEWYEWRDAEDEKQR